MENEQPFLDAIQRHPAELPTRLIYADWLDDHGESQRAEYLREVCRLASCGLASPEAAGHFERLANWKQNCPEKWVTAVTGAFEVVINKIPLGGSAMAIELLLQHWPRLTQEELWILLRHCPAVLSDQMEPDVAVRLSQVLSDRLIWGVIDRAISSGNDYLIERSEHFRTEVERMNNVLLLPRPMSWQQTPQPARFDVVVTSHFSCFHSGGAQDLDYLIPPLQGIFGMEQQDATALLYSGYPYKIHTQLAFTHASEQSAVLRKAFKKHTMYRMLAESVNIVVQPVNSPPTEPE